MAEISPFKGLLFNKEIIKDFSQVVTQPYDKISPQLQQEYYNRSPYNIIRIEKNQAEVENDAYKTAAFYLEVWHKKGVISKSQNSGYYYLEQTFEFFKEQITRKALIGMGKLHPYSANIILPHEQTLKGPKIDRLKLLEATKINLGQIFMLYKDKEKLLDTYIAGINKEVVLEFYDDEKIKQKLYFIDDKVAVAKITALLQDKQLFIADGHHRYETALAYSQDHPSADCHMMSFVNAYDDGLKILPTHRLINFDLQYDYSNLIKELGKHFLIKPLPATQNADNINDYINQLPPKSCILISKEDKHNFLQLTLRNEVNSSTTLSASLTELDVYILHHYIIENILGITKEDLANHTYITYKRDATGSVNEVINDKQALCFLLKPTAVDEVLKVALNKETMPQKSTDFYPKLLTGYVMADVS